MGKLILVTGGVRSGKSVFAEELIRSYGESVLYIATAVAVDEELQYRIDRHRELRPAEWDTLEAYRDIHQHLEDVGAGYDAIMLDCVTVMVENLLLAYQAVNWGQADIQTLVRIEKEVRREVRKTIDAARTVPPPVVFVTNEVGFAMEPKEQLARTYRNIASRVNTMLASEADEAYLLVSGIPVKIK